MITTAEMHELEQIINSAHADPHHILGMHETTLNGKNCLAVRAFIPGAAGITVLDPKDGSLAYEMERIHYDGFFEVVIPDREKWFRYQLRVEYGDGNRWICYDPYSFTPVISEMDLYLFGEGTHYEIFEKLGAHVMSVDGVDGVLFAVWAPNAYRVSVIGNFNNWDGRRGQMRMLNRSGVWELFVPGLVINDKYKFEIKTHDGRIFQKTDPYGNFAELRPSTASLVFDLNRYKWDDDAWLKKRDQLNTLGSPVNIYEVHPGSWKLAENDNNRFLSYVELADQLIPYVKKMGYTHVELMGILEYPFDGSWGYQVTGYFAPTSRYGSPDEFMYFIDKCHQNEVGVILDWVPAHFPKDAHGLARFDGSALYEHEDRRQGEHPDWGTLIFNYGRSEVKNFLIASAIFWIEKFHLDGLRVDAVASMLYLDYGKKDGEWAPNKYGGKENLEAIEFMKHMNSVILGRQPHVFMIAEESTSWSGVSRPAELNGLGFNLKWNMGWMNDFLTYMSKDPIYRKYYHHSLTFSMIYAYTENFVLVLSHDEVVHGKNSLINKMPGDLWQKFANLRVALGFMYGHPGKKLLFMGGEFAQFIEWDEKRPLDWFLLEYDHHKQMHKYVQDLNFLYKNDISFWYDDFKGDGFEWIECGDAASSVVSFFRKGPEPEDITVFVCNFTPVAHEEHRIGVPLNCVYHEIFNSDYSEYGGSGIYNGADLPAEEIPWSNRKYSLQLKVPPLGMAVLKPKK